MRTSETEMNIKDLEAENARLRDVLSAFGNVADVLVEEMPDGSFIWKEGSHNERISAWFGPTALGEAMRILKKIE